MKETLPDEALASLPDEVLQRHWREGVESDSAGEIDFDALKAEARQASELQSPFPG